jgi:Protein of unknown function DUF262
MPPKLETLEITDERRENAEAEIREKQQPVDYDTKEYPIEILIQKYQEGLDDDTNELFIPDYQREMTWDEERQSKFIESVLLGLPIPYIFVADVSDEDNDLARLEIIDGSQRIRTLARFINNELKLRGLKKLETLNGFIFDNLPLSRRRRFQRATIRMIQLTENADEEVRRDIFERINTGSVELNPMEKRRGIFRGHCLDLIEELSNNKNFLNLCAFTKAAIDRQDHTEYVLRFFAFLNNYENFGRDVHPFLDEYLKKCNKNKSLEREQMRTEFLSMLNFVEKYLPNGFRTGKNSNKTTTRIKFESIAVGIALALREDQSRKTKTIEWLNSNEFKDYTKSDGSSSKNKVIRRIEYVRDQVTANL